LIKNLNFQSEIVLLCIFDYHYTTTHTNNMGLGSKLRKRNRATATTLAGATNSVTNAGYNASNIPSLAPSAPMNEDDRYEVNELRQEAQAEIRNATTCGSGANALRKPDVPHNADADRLMINGLVVDKMWRIVCLKGLHAFFSQSQLQETVTRACLHDYRILMRDWNIATIDMACDLAVLGLFDIIFLGDDSGSMAKTEDSEDGMTRWELLRIVVKTLGFWATLMDPDGVVVRMFNNDLTGKGDGVASQQDVEDLFRGVPDPSITGYTTPMGESIASVMRDIVYPLMSDQGLQRPVLLLTITDGRPGPHSGAEAAVVSAISDCHDRAARSIYGEHAVSFGFSQVGSSKSAQGWLDEIDKDRKVGKLVDCTSNYQMEKAECFAKYGIELSPSSYLIKAMIGAVDPTYDAMDGEDQGASASGVTTTSTTSYSAPPVYRR
jgi:hypothetical protein